MRISTEIGSIAAQVGEEKAIELAAKAGFDAFDLSMFVMCDYDWTNKRVRPSEHPFAGSGYASFAKRLRHIADECGIVCNQSHAPFPTCCQTIRDHFKRAIECTAILGGKICVIHPDNDKTAKENAEMYFELIPFAKEYGVKIATENMWNWRGGRADFAACSTASDFVAHLDAVNDPFFVACLDIGHAEMMGEQVSAVGMIHALGKRLEALHIHDNDRWHDSHQIPFSMQIDFAAVIKALKEIGYNGDLTLEADSYLGAFASDDLFKGVCDLADSARRLRELYESV